MKIHVLGSGAGGGFPQWNCNCENCAGFRAGKLRARARTQSSIAVSGDGENWVLINASPDIRQQLADAPHMQPNRGLRDTAISAVLLIDSQIDHTTGLLTLREGKRLPIYCTSNVEADLTSGFPLFSMLSHYCGVDWQQIQPEGQSFTIPEAPGLEFAALPIASAAPPYSPHRQDPHPGDTIALRITDPASGKKLFYAPGLGAHDADTRAWMAESDLLLVDGTFWTEDEMITRGVGTKPAASMGHLPQSGENGMIELLRPMPARKVLIHINNTNPILDEDSAERKILADEGIEVAHDGLQLTL
jgi:pyrroloquinoline quinone biosynthesis protein B